MVNQEDVMVCSSSINNKLIIRLEWIIVCARANKKTLIYFKNKHKYIINNYIQIIIKIIS